MTTEQIAESLVNRGRGAYSPADVVDLIKKGIRQSQRAELEKSRDAAIEELERR